MTQPEDGPVSSDSRGPGTRVRPLLLLILVALALAATSLAGGAVIDSDTVIDTATEWSDAQVTVSATVTVASGGTLLVNGSDLVFDGVEADQVGIIVEPGGALVLMGVTATAAEDPYVIYSDGSVTISDSDLEGLYYRQDEEAFAGLVGGVVANSGSMVIENVDILSEGIGVSAYDCDLEVDGLTVRGGEYGLLLDGTAADIADVTVTDMIMAFVIRDCDITIADSRVDRVNWTLWAVTSDVTITGMDSRPYADHLAFENSTSSVRDSAFHGGQEGAVAILGHMEVVGCHFNGTRTAIELLYAEGRIVDTLVEDCADMSVVLSFVGYNVDEPDFEMSNVTIRDGAEAALDVDSVQGLTVRDLVIEGCGDGINVASSSIAFTDVLITGSTQCRPTGCSYVATGTGILAETTELMLTNVTIVGSNGPAVSSYWSYVNATGSSFKDGNASGLLMVYSMPFLEDCEISGNALWGIESLGWDFEPEDLDVTWGNDLADVRLNMTINAKVEDQYGKWLSHAEVTATSGDQAVGPYTTGFEGSTQTYELPILEWTDGGARVEFNPWTFTVVYGDYTNATQVDLELGLGQITLHVEVLRGDLIIESMRSPRKVDRDGQATITAIVANVGNTTVEEAVLTFYYRDSNGFQRVIGETTVGPIEPGGTDQGSTAWAPAVRGRYTIVAFVDVDDKVDEENDDNNRAEREMTVDGESESAPGPGAAMMMTVLVLAGLASAASRRRR